MPVRLKRAVDVPPEVQVLTGLFKQAGFELYLVGGAVRDALLNKRPKDFDLATNAVPDKVVQVLSSIVGINILEVGKAFGVIKAVFASGFECEIATFRCDVCAGRRPDSVVFSTIEHDVLRRDLTINALFYDLSTSEVVDYVNGIYDLDHGIIRTVGRPEDRFNEDRLRVLRAVRFAAQMGCELEHETETAIRRDNGLRGVSAERIRDELLKCIEKAHSVTHLAQLMSRLHLWSEVLPGLCVRPERIREVRDPVLVLASLLSVDDPDVVAKTLHELKYTLDETRQIAFLLTFTKLDLNNVLKLHRSFRINKLAPEQIRRWSQFMNLDLHLVDTFLRYEPSVKGDDLIVEGFQGAALGLELERREKVLFLQLLNGTQG